MMPSYSLDPFAGALEYYWKTGKSALYYTREDGYRTRENVAWYFTSFRDFLPVEKKLLRFVRGRVLDVGCGAGRHALYLQRKGFAVTALESSPRVAALARARGVCEVQVVSACEPLPFGKGEFDTVLCLGNNLGLCGSRSGLKRMLKELWRITSAKARLLATTRAPGMFADKHRAYWERKLERGEPIGVVRMRLDFGQNKKWVSLYLIAPSDLMQLAWSVGWRVAHVLGDGRADEGYGVVMEKR